MKNIIFIEHVDYNFFFVINVLSNSRWYKFIKKNDIWPARILGRFFPHV